MSWEKVKLREVIDEISNGSRPKGGVNTSGDIPSLGAEHLNSNGGFNFLKIKRISYKFYQQQKNGKINPNDILLVKDGATTGKVSFVNQSFPFKESSINEHLFKISINLKKASPKYIFYHLFSKIGQEQILNDFRGATVGGISKGFIDKVEFQLPPINIQQQISSILDLAIGICIQNKETIQKYDELAQALFLEMFGDEFDIEKYPIKTLNSVSEVVSGVTKGRKFNGKSTVHVPYMRVANVQDGHIDFTEIKTIEVLPDDVEKFRLIPGDILLTEGGDPDKLGRGAVWKFEVNNCIHQNHIFRVRVNREILNPDFLSALFGNKYGKKYFLRAAKQTTGIASINSTQLKAFPVVIPPLYLQDKFSVILGQLEQQKKMINKSQEYSEKLFQTLLNKFFS